MRAPGYTAVGTDATTVSGSGYVLTERARSSNAASRRTRDERSRCAIRARHDRNGLPNVRTRDGLLGGLFPASREASRRRGGGQADARNEGYLEWADHVAW